MYGLFGIALIITKVVRCFTRYEDLQELTMLLVPKWSSENFVGHSLPGTVQDSPWYLLVYYSNNMAYGGPPPPPFVRIIPCLCCFHVAMMEQPHSWALSPPDGGGQPFPLFPFLPFRNPSSSQTVVAHIFSTFLLFRIITSQQSTTLQFVLFATPSAA